MPTKKLPAKANLNHLRAQARDLMAAFLAHDPSAHQLAREFHPALRGVCDAELKETKFALADAQLVVARRYGYASWPKLKSRVQAGPPPGDERPLHEQIGDLEFRRAVDFIDAGDVESLKALVAQVPGLLTRRVRFEGLNYFLEPCLIDFVAENPIRNDRMPPNVVEVAATLIELGAAELDSVLGLVATGSVAREWGYQRPLLDLLVRAGADPNTAMPGALAHGEMDAVECLLSLGGQRDLRVAAALDDAEGVRMALASSALTVRHVALALAAQHGAASALRVLLEAGEDPNRYNPVGFHAHSAPLHQTALAGHTECARLLVRFGASKDYRDLMWGGTPADWARHGNHAALADELAP